jgi:hypothetical protein
MARTKKTTAPVVEVQTQAPRILEDLTPKVKTMDLDEAMALAEINRQIQLGNSAVKPKYKIKYKMRAIAAGDKGKAMKRSNGDWLSRRMKELCLDKKEKLIVSNLVAVCEANGLDGIEERWPNKNNGWEGRLRMTACLVLRKIVADNGFLMLPDGTQLEAPADFVTLNETR